MTNDDEPDIFAHPEEDYKQTGYEPVDDEWKIFSHLLGSDEFIEAEHSLYTQRTSYEFNGDPYHALVAFQICRRYDAPIPEWVLKWLQDGFSKYSGTLLDDSEKSDLGQCLGIDTQTRLDRPTHLQKLLDKTTMLKVKEQVRGLMMTYHFTIDQACDLVAARDRASDNHRKKTIIKDQIVASYKKERWGDCASDALLIPRKFQVSVLETFVGLDIQETTAKKLADTINSIRTLIAAK